MTSHPPAQSVNSIASVALNRRKARFRRSQETMPRSIETLMVIPVTCPVCKVEALVKAPALVVRTALTVWNQMVMRSPCHEQQWSATPAELARVREHLGPPYSATQPSAQSMAHDRPSSAHVKRLP